MKVGIITKSNQKGQIVIPKKFRDALDIDADDLLKLVIRGRGIYIYPVEDVITSGETKDSYLKALEKTQGSWTKDDWPKLREKRRHIELRASKRRKYIW